MTTKLRSPLHAEHINTHRPLRWRSILGLVMVPLLVAGLLLGTTWGRDGRLDRINAAVVNLDQAVEVKGQPVPMGRQLAAEITSQDSANISWTLSDAADAAEGLAEGRYAAVVTIPKNFSKAATSVADADKAEQAVIDVVTSPAAPVEDAQIAQQVADLASQSTNAMLTGEYLKNIYIGFNTMGEQFVTLSDAAGQLSKGANQLADGTSEAAQGTGELGKGMAALDENGSKLASGGSELVSGGGELATGATTLAGGVKAYTNGAGKLVDGIGTFNTGVQGYTAGTGKVVDGIGTLSGGVKSYTDGAGKLVDGIGSFSTGVQGYTNGTAKVVDGIGGVNTGIQQLNKGVQQVPTLDKKQVDQLQASLGQISTAVGGLQGVEKTLQRTAYSKQVLKEAQQAGAAAQQQCLRQAEQGAGQGSGDGSGQGEGGGQANPAASCATVAQYVTSSVDTAIKQSSRTALEQFAALDPETRKGIEQAAGSLETLPQQLGQLSALKSGAAELAAGSQQLATQSQQLKTGGAELAKGAGTLASQSQQLKSGGQELAKGANTLATQSQQLKSGGQELAKGANTLALQSQQLKSGGAELATGAGTLAGGLKKYTDGVTTYADGVRQYTDGVSQANDGAQELSSGMTKLAAGSSQLADGTKKFATGLEQGKDEVPSYSQEQRERLSSVVSTPVAGGADTINTPLKQTTTLLLVLGTWLGAMATWLLVRPVASRTLTSSRPSWQLAAATMLPSAGIAVAQAVLLGVLGSVVMGLGFGRGLSLVAFLSLAALCFMAVNQALVAWLGGIGRTIAVVLATVTAAVGLVSAVPGVFGTIHGLSPLAPALTGVRRIVADTAMGVGPIGTLLGLWLVAAVACLLAVVRRRQISPSAFRRARSEDLV